MPPPSLIQPQDPLLNPPSEAEGSLTPLPLTTSAGLPHCALGQHRSLFFQDVFQGTRAGKVPGGLGTVPVLFTPTSLALLNTPLPPHRHPHCWPLPRGIQHMKRRKKTGSTHQTEGREVTWDKKQHPWNCCCCCWVTEPMPPLHQSHSRLCWKLEILALLSASMLQAPSCHKHN